MNILLIGNGFDKAHGLPTTYWDFIEHMKKTKKEKGPNKNEYAEIMHSHKEGFKSEILPQLKKTWSGIEDNYYKLLNTTKKTKNKAAKLNKELNLIKKHFEVYLHNYASNPKKINSYQQIFNRFDSNTVIVNYNYTSTLEIYDLNEKIEILHLHGKINDELNPIIFGCAPPEEETEELLKLGDIFLENIKQYQYFKSDKYHSLMKIFKEESSINIFLMGLSCGEADNLILNQIFGHEKVKSIFNFYFDGDNGMTNHVNTFYNISRIIGTMKAGALYLPFPQVMRMPQVEDKDSGKPPLDIHDLFKINHGRPVALIL